jgi:tetratricopeptide (TPR) repeat protein
MKQVVPDKHTIAWFKLAECVSRGERERALGVYRLLAHSIGNPAFENQLEGDLYLSFQDIQAAITKYQEAVRLYCQSGRLLEAAAVLEHLVTLQPHTHTHHQQLIELYHQLRLSRKVQEHIARTLALMSNGYHDRQLEEFLGSLDKLDAEYADYAAEILISQTNI